LNYEINIFVLILAFFWIPFLYFYNNEEISDGSDTDISSIIRKAKSALKRISLFVGSIFIIILVGRILYPDYSEL